MRERQGEGGIQVCIGTEQTCTHTNTHVHTHTHTIEHKSTDGLSER